MPETVVYFTCIISFVLTTRGSVGCCSARFTGKETVLSHGAGEESSPILGTGRTEFTPSRGCASCQGLSNPQCGPLLSSCLLGDTPTWFGSWTGSSGFLQGDQTILSGTVKPGCVYTSPQELKEDFACPHDLLHRQCPLKDGFIMIPGLPHENTNS